MTSTDVSTFECGGIVCDDQRLMEMAGAQVMVFANRAETQRIALQHGLTSPHPFMQCVVGIALGATAYIPISRASNLFASGTQLIEIGIWLIVISVIGLWLFMGAFHVGYFLEVETPGGRKRLVFKSRPDVASLNRFITSIEQRWGVVVART